MSEIEQLDELEESVQPDDVESTDDTFDEEPALESEEIEVDLGERRLVFTVDEIENLVKIRDQAKELEKEVSRLREYEALANFVAGDELTNRVALYRMQGNSPPEIVLFLYQHMVDNGMIDPYTNTVIQKQEQPETEKQNSALQEELGRLKGYVETQAIYQNNTNVIGQVLAETEFDIPINEEVTEELRKVSSEIFGDPDYLLRRPVTKAQAKVLIKELKERLSNVKKEPSKASSAKKVYVRAKNLPAHFPAKTRAASAAARRNLPKEYSLQNAALAYRALFEE